MTSNSTPCTSNFVALFTTSVHAILGSLTKPEDSPTEEITPKWEKYSDNMDGFEGTPDNPEGIEPTPIAGNSYLNTEILLAARGAIERGHIANDKCDHQGHPTGPSNTNTILDIRNYDIEFDDGSVSNLTTSLKLLWDLFWGQSSPLSSLKTQ